MSMKKYVSIIAFALFAMAYLLPSAAIAASMKSARETLENQADRLVETLESDASDAAKREAIREQVSGFFDFELMSRLALSYHWKQMGPQEQRQFVPLYKKLLEKTYMDRLLDYNDQKIQFGEGTQLADNRVMIRTYVVSKQQTIPMDYRMVLSDGRWQVYDIVIENVSMAKNYRSQFNSFLQDKSVEQLLDELRQKTGEKERG